MPAIRQSRPARAVPATPYPPEQAIHQTPHGASGTPPPTYDFYGQTKKVSALAKPPGGVKTPPYSTIGKGDVGGDACIAPQVAAHLCGPMTSIDPYSMGVEEFRPRRGQYGEEPKSVKKNAALLHFLAFGFFDHIFGVPRGRAPLGGVRCLATARLFSLPFLVTKKVGLTARCRYKRPCRKVGRAGSSPRQSDSQSQ